MPLIIYAQAAPAHTLAAAAAAAAAPAPRQNAGQRWDWPFCCRLLAQAQPTRTLLNSGRVQRLQGRGSAAGLRCAQQETPDTPPAASAGRTAAALRSAAGRSHPRQRPRRRKQKSLHTYGSAPQRRWTGDMAHPHPFCVLFTGCGRAMATSLPGRRRTGWVMEWGGGCSAGGNRAAAPLLRLLKARVSYAISTHIVLSRSICTVSPVPKRARSQCISRSERGSSVLSLLLQTSSFPSPFPPFPSSSRERRWRLP